MTEEAPTSLATDAADGTDARIWSVIETDVVGRSVVDNEQVTAEAKDATTIIFDFDLISCGTDLLTLQERIEKK